MPSEATTHFGILIPTVLRVSRLGAPIFCAPSSQDKSPGIRRDRPGRTVNTDQRRFGRPLWLASSCLRLGRLGQLRLPELARARLELRSRPVKLQASSGQYDRANWLTSKPLTHLGIRMASRPNTFRRAQGGRQEERGFG